MTARKNFKKNPTEIFISQTELEQTEQQDGEQDGEQKPFVIPKGYILQREYKSERIQLLVRPTTKVALKKAAAMQGLSVNELANIIIENYLERQDIE